MLSNLPDIPIKNGYIVPDDELISKLTEKTAVLDPQEVKVGVHSDVQVVFGGKKLILVTSQYLTVQESGTFYLCTSTTTSDTSIYSFH